MIAIPGRLSSQPEGYVIESSTEAQDLNNELAIDRETRGGLQHKLRQVDAVNDVRLAIDRETRGASEHGIGARFVPREGELPQKFCDIFGVGGDAGGGA